MYQVNLLFTALDFVSFVIIQNKLLFGIQCFPPRGERIWHLEDNSQRLNRNVDDLKKKIG